MPENEVANIVCCKEKSYLYKHSCVTAMLVQVQPDAPIYLIKYMAIILTSDLSEHTCFDAMKYGNEIGILEKIKEVCIFGTSTV